MHIWCRFDEVHFGGFAAKYLRGEYFLDVHPPLARLLVTLSAWLGGFRGEFNFYDIGADYLKNKVPYVTMRSFTATLGALVVPVAFISLRCIGVSNVVSGAAAAMLLFENALTTQSRLILLDSYLVFFTATTAMFWLLFCQERHAPFKLKWWTWLALCGVSLGLVASCKWVGLFVVAVLGLYTITDLWRTFGDVSVPLVFLMNTNLLLILTLDQSGAAFWRQSIVSDCHTLSHICWHFFHSLSTLGKLEHWSQWNVGCLPANIEGRRPCTCLQRYLVACLLT